MRFPKQIYSVFKDLKDRAKETMIGVYLDDDLEVRAYEVLSVGTANQTIVSPAEILEYAILLKSKRFILIHNHPSGDPRPSQADRLAMVDLASRAKVLDRTLLDFIIVGDLVSRKKKNYWSMFEEEDGKEYCLGSAL